MRDSGLSNLEVQNTHQRCSSVHQKRNIPPGVFKRKPQAEAERIKFNKKRLRELFKERMSEYSDALTYDDVAKITGRARGCVCKWTSAGKLKVVKLNSNVSIVPKQWLLEFMLTDDFIYNYPRDGKLKPILNQAIIKR